MSLAQCIWPSLAEPYHAALIEAIDYVFSRFNPTGIMATGTIVRGKPGPASDLDIHILHHKPERQRVQKFFHGVPAEIFVNPPAQVERYFAQESEEGRPVTAHMYATGFVVYDPVGMVKRLHAQANEVLAAGPRPSPGFLIAQRYGVATWLEDALDIADANPEACLTLLAKAVDGAVRYRFWAARQWQPRPKEFLHALSDLDPDLAGLVRRFHRAAGVEDRIGLGREIVQRSVGATGFFEWESEAQAVET